jgi:uncharacterized protein YutE (UPF0331/DUF86 family)
MLEKDALLAKISIIKNCLQTINKITGLDPARLDDFIIQDVFVLNLQRAVQAAIDIANIIIAFKGWRLPVSYKDAFKELSDQKVISKTMFEQMSRMIGFRNIAVHEYQELKKEILASILTNNLEDLERFYTVVFKRFVQANG